MGPFADSHVPGFSDAEMDQFEVLLDQPDHDLYAWITGSQAIPSQFDHDVMRRLCAFRPSDLPAGERT